MPTPNNPRRNRPVQWYCDICRRLHSTEEDALLCEKDPLPDLPLPPGSVIVEMAPNGSAQKAEVVSATGFCWPRHRDVRTGEIVPHRRAYVCKAPTAAYDFVVNPEDILTVVSEAPP